MDLIDLVSEIEQTNDAVSPLVKAQLKTATEVVASVQRFERRAARAGHNRQATALRRIGLVAQRALMRALELETR